jgi:hypothetical protein
MKKAMVFLVLVIASGSLLVSSTRVIPGGSAKLTGEDPQVPPPFHVVARFLGLSQDQLLDLVQLRQETGPALAEARRQVGELQVLLKQSLNEEVANAGELGDLLLRLQAARQKVHELHQSFVETFRDTLVEEQRHKLHLVFRTARMQKILPVFKQVGLLP